METISILTIKDIEEVVDKAVSKLLLQLNNRPNSVIPDMFDKKEAAKYLKISVSTVDNLRRLGELKSTPVKGINKVLFRYSDILDYVNSSNSS